MSFKGHQKGLGAQMGAHSASDFREVSIHAAQRAECESCRGTIDLLINQQIGDRDEFLGRIHCRGHAARDCLIAV